MNKKIVTGQNKFNFAWLVLVLYMGFLVLVMYFHEPWMDEAQAWQIARGASLRELFATVTHYEGHPPLWHLILMPFAKLGMPYEISLKGISFVICSISMSFVIFRAPFPKIVRYLLPFNYFFFYQYGVISRNYCLMTLGFILAAMTWKKKNEKPVLFVLSLALLCGASSYGIILSGGICVAWLLELWKGKTISGFFNELIQKKRLFALGSLLVWALGMIYLVLPQKDTYAFQEKKGSSFFYGLFRFVFISLPDAVYSNICFNISSRADMFEMAAGLFQGGLLILLIIVVGRGFKKNALFWIPFSLLALFSSRFYFSIHHTGIITLLLLFWLWVCMEDGGFVFPEWLQKALKTERDRKSLKGVGYLVMGVVLVIPVFWSISASYHDVKVCYGEGRQMSAFIKEHEIDKGLIMGSWKVKEGEKDFTPWNINLIQGTALMPYFDHNFIYNYNSGNDNKAYLTHESGDLDVVLEEWRKKGYPDYIIGSCDLYSLFGKGADVPVYVPIYQEIAMLNIWKDWKSPYPTYIFARKDIVDSREDLKEVELRNDLYLQ